AGEWQLMSAGTGVQHSEINNTDEPVHLFQIWIQPNIRNAEPSYQIRIREQISAFLKKDIPVLFFPEATTTDGKTI
ncbi:pirin family protein, partial [Acinetobacter soli]|uniref:pirin family protein n=1 Tax=Acinetobacter soli TaxID=487316 RepID=UPI0028145FCB